MRGPVISRLFIWANMFCPNASENQTTSWTGVWRICEGLGVNDLAWWRPGIGRRSFIKMQFRPRSHWLTVNGQNIVSACVQYFVFVCRTVQDPQMFSPQKKIRHCNVALATQSTNCPFHTKKPIEKERERPPQQQRRCVKVTRGSSYSILTVSSLLSTLPSRWWELCT